MDKEYLLNANLLEGAHNHLLLMTVNGENIKVEFAFKFEKMVIQKGQSVEKEAFDVNDYELAIPDKENDPIFKVNSYVLLKNSKK